jgi:hypothetical protein
MLQQIAKRYQVLTCLCKCYMIVVNKRARDIKFSQCLCKCYMIVVNKRARDIKFSQCLGKCYMNAVNVYVNVTTNRQERSSSHNIFVKIVLLALAKS